MVPSESATAGRRHFLSSLMTLKKIPRGDVASLWHDEPLLELPWRAEDGKGDLTIILQ